MSSSPGTNRAPFSFDDIRAATGATGEGSGRVTGVTTDSRAVAAGNLFVALKGEKFDGHAYAHTAAEAGAAAILASSPVVSDLPVLTVPDTLAALGALARFHRRRYSAPVIGVTGSVGKTTTRAFILAALNAGLSTLSSQANFNNEIGVPLTLLQWTNESAALLEMGMRGAGQIDYLAKIAEPTVGVITNIGPQHIEFLGSTENIALAKAELLENLPENGLAVLPADSPYLPILQSKASCRVVTFGTAADANYRAHGITSGPDGSLNFMVRLANGSSVAVSLPLPGSHNAANAAAALAVATELGVSPEAAAAALSHVEVPGARMRVIRLGDGTVLLDDCYNAGPDSTKAALQTLLDFPGSGRRVAILGDMKELGNESELHHSSVGRLAGQIAEVLVGIGGETRPLLNAAVESAREVENGIQTHYADTAAEAAGRAGEWVQPGDVILVKGSRSVGLETVVEALKGKS